MKYSWLVERPLSVSVERFEVFFYMNVGFIMARFSRQIRLLFEKQDAQTILTFISAKHYNVYLRLPYIVVM
ncbi:hypothetical protein XI25_10590 [Paenibacillus sp. DMB20]|nr:hypothetical protein XI25_10590 [Paenibacillus sp. DMB20]